MAITDALLPEYDHEMATTRRVLERVPEPHLEWRPHIRSMSMAQLSAHVANIPLWLRLTLEHATMDLDAVEPPIAPPATRGELLAAFDEKSKTARDLLASRSDADLLAPWTLKKGGHEIFTMPRISVVRTFVMNHLIHHRGQLTVYLRLKDVPLPPVYGPTADEQ